MNQQELLILTARYVRQCLYKYQHSMGDFAGSAMYCNMFDLCQAALGETGYQPQVPVEKLIEAASWELK